MSQLYTDIKLPSLFTRKNFTVRLIPSVLSSVKLTCHRTVFFFIHSFSIVISLVYTIKYSCRCLPMNLAMQNLVGKFHHNIPMKIFCLYFCLYLSILWQWKYFILHHKRQTKEQWINIWSVVSIAELHNGQSAWAAVNTWCFNRKEPVQIPSCIANHMKHWILGGPILIQTLHWKGLTDPLQYIRSSKRWQDWTVSAPSLVRFHTLTSFLVWHSWMEFNKSNKEVTCWISKLLRVLRSFNSPSSSHLQTIFPLLQLLH